MARLVDEAMTSGALGFASSWAPTHRGDQGRPVPSRVADLAEVAALLEPLRTQGKGVVALLPGGVMANDVMFDLQRHIGRPFTWTALLTIAGSERYKDVMAEHAAARATGVEVWPQVSCRPLVFQLTMLEPFTFNPWPNFAELMDRPLDERIAAYRDRSWRDSTWEQFQGGLSQMLNWSSMAVAESAKRPELVGRSITDLAEEQSITPLDVMLDVALSDDLMTRFSSVIANNDPKGIAFLLQRDDVLLGLADSGAHVSQLCDACFATDLLGNWVREREVMPIEQAVHKLTGEPAAVYSLSDRGVLAVGQAADVVVFDPETVAPGPLRRVVDFPANGERLTADAPVGMTHTLVNGVPIRIDGSADPEGFDKRAGTLLRA